MVFWLPDCMDQVQFDIAPFPLMGDRVAKKNVKPSHAHLNCIDVLFPSRAGIPSVLSRCLAFDGVPPYADGGCRS
jgi:hypothetical protein